MSTTPPALDMASILADTSNRVVVCCGAGGVGKTTTAAAMALRAAEYGRTVVVLTIDPAKRLAQALGIKDLGNTPQRVPLAPEVTGELHAMMLDMRRTFDEMVHPVLGSRTRTSRFWTTSSIRPSPRRSQALRSTWRWRSSGSCSPRTGGTSSSSTPLRRATRWTSSMPRNGSAASWTAGCGSCCWPPVAASASSVTGAMGLAMRALSTVLGSQMLSDAAAFVQSLDATFGGFREKADRTYDLLKRRGTQFVVVSAAEPDALREASFFIDRLSQENMPLSGLILNRTHPMLSSLHADKADEAAEALESRDPDSVTAAVLRIHSDRAGRSKREIRLLSRFTGANPHVAIVGVPSLPFDVSDLEALRAIADQITGDAA